MDLPRKPRSCATISASEALARAGMTPPALYRYFPNKFAVLSELGRRLMAAQDEVVFAWLDAGGLKAGPVEARVEVTRRLLMEVNAVTRRQTGAMWILRAMHAVPMLQQVHIESREAVAARFLPELRRIYPHVPLKQLMMADRLSSEIMYSAMEVAM
jgi:AcrR family transcriptional regulator